jgi:alpha-ketoglutaric semialdehyde dehydrogenase
MITGELLIGRRAVRGAGADIQPFTASSGTPLTPAFPAADKTQVDEACRLAEAAFDTFRETTPEVRAKLLESIADKLIAAKDEIVERAMQEAGLPRPRIEGELGRTAGQLRLFAGVLRDGSYLDVRIDPAMPERAPLPRPDLRLRNIPLGPVAVFGASNFPLAFSVAGGDTASALAAGCPVVAKGHSAHLGTSELVGRAVQAAVAEAGLPEGVFSLVYDAGFDVGQALVAHPAIKAVGFTGSRRGGEALLRTAQARPEPIPVYAEMSAVNPVILFPDALAGRGEAIAKTFVGALTLGAGQFCTNPGLILAVDGPDLDRFLTATREALEAAAAATMLTPGIHQAYCAGVSALEGHAEVKLIGRGQAGEAHQGRAGVFRTTAKAFLADPKLQEEVFGAVSLAVACPDADTLAEVLEAMEGQLTIAFHADEGDYPLAARLLPTAERRCGRIVFNGFGTGVEVGHAMVHGGPYPATSDPRATSVGSLAIYRFVRPVSYQDVPEALLPAAVKQANPLGLPRSLDGKPAA